MERARHLLRSSVIVIALLGLGKVIGLFRTRMVSGAFGTSSEFDAFNSANQLPELFVVLISGGALAAAFIPVYSDYLTSKKSRESAQLANSILTLVIVVLGGVSVVGIIFADWFTAEILVPEFSPELQDLTAQLMRIILLQTTLFGISGVLSSILNAHQHFALPALAPIALDIGYFIGVLVFVPNMGIVGLAWGTVVGSLIHILIQVPALIRFGFVYKPEIAFRLVGVREVVKLMIPRIMTLGSVQFADIFIIRLASGLATGSISSYLYGYTLMQLPETLLGTAIAFVVFPTMSELYNAGDIEGLKRTSMTSLQIIWFLTFPTSVALVLLGRQAITIFLERGAFDESSTQLVYGVLVFFSLRLISEASLEILARLFYAQHNTVTPMLVSFGWLVANVLLSYLFVNSLGIRGLALASTIAFTLQSVTLYILNRRHLGYLYERELLTSAGRAILGAAGMAAVILLLGQIVVNDFLLLILGGTAGFITYFAITYISGAREIPSLVNIVRSR